MTEATLTIKIDSTQVEAAKRSLAELGGTAGGAEKATTSLTQSAKGLAAALGIGLSASYFKNLIVGAIDAADRMNDLKKSTGLSIETLAGLELASKQTGGNLDSIAQTINRLSQNVGNNTEKFKALGITARDPLEAFKQLSDQFVKLENPQARAALAAEALGRGWQGAAPLLSEGSKAIQEMVDKGQRLSGMTTKLAEDADALNDTWAELGTSGRGLLNQALIPMLPAIQNVSTAVSTFASSDAFPVWIDQARMAVELLAIVLSVRLAASLATTTVAMVSATTATSSFAGALALVGGPVTAITLALGTLALAYRNITQTQKEAKIGALEWIAANDGVAGLDLAMYSVAQKIKTASEEINNLGTGIRAVSREKQLREEIKRLSDEITVLANKRAELTKNEEAAKATVADLTVETRVLTAAEAKLNSELSVGILKYDDAKNSLLDMGVVMQSLRTGHVPGLDKTFENLIARVEQTKFRMIGVTDAAGTAKPAIDALSGSVNYQTNMLENVQREWGDLISQLIRGKSDFGDFFDSIAKGFLSMVSQMAAADLAKAIFGGGGLGALTSGNLAGLVTGGGGGGLIGTAGTVAKVASNLPGISTAVSSIAGAAGIGTLATTGGWVAPSMVAPAASSGLIASISSGVSSAASAVGSFLSAIPGWGWALAGAGVLAKVLDDSGTMSHNAGFLTQNLPSAQGDTFALDKFPSGAQFYGFNRRTGTDEALAVADVFRNYDGALTALANSVGIKPNLSGADFAGLNEKGQGRGAFFGSASEDKGGKGQDITSQLDSYTRQWITMVAGQNNVDPTVLADILAQGSADRMIAHAQATYSPKSDGSHASGLSYVPFDGYRATLHTGERVQTASDARATDNLIKQLQVGFSEMQHALTVIVANTGATGRALDEAVRTGGGSLSVVVV